MRYVNLGINSAIYTKLTNMNTQDIVYFIDILETIINNYTFDYSKQIFIGRLKELRRELKQRNG